MPIDEMGNGVLYQVLCWKNGEWVRAWDVFVPWEMGPERRKRAKIEQESFAVRLSRERGTE
jgi:hypothetical protein